ncbi:MAG: hypothetical protein CSA66_07865 [Proteobacteria bacterium]|nr:MAG: hypothetical protein CSA66_07865 [Pseudomonadota bacterium]
MVVATASKAHDLGAKHRCTSCGTRYYDLGRQRAACPKCGAAAIEGAVATVPAVAPTRRTEDEDAKRGRLLSGLSAEEVDRAKRDELDQLTELLVSYGW